MNGFLSVELVAMVILGAGFLLPFSIWYYSRRRFEAAEVAAKIMFWATLPLLAAEAIALSISMETYGAPLLRIRQGPSPELVGLAYPPFAVVASLLLARAARSGIGEQDLRRSEEPRETSGEARRHRRDDDPPAPPPGA